MLIVIYGVLTAGAIIAGSEVLKLDKKILAALLLSAIAFIYVGLIGSDLTKLFIYGIQGLVFFLLAYFGLAKQRPQLISSGLFLHGIWDLGHLISGTKSTLPEGYEIYCITIDILLAGYFWYSFKKEKRIGS